jgi:hypothetical protein
MHSDVVILRDIRPHCSVGCKNLISNGFQVLPVIFKSKKIEYILKICRKLKLLFLNFNKSNWIIDFSILSNSSTIIIFDSSIEYFLCKYLQNNFSNKKLILYYWNTINIKKKNEISYFKKHWDIYSFNLDDCIKYKIKFNKLFSPISDDMNTSITQKIKQDVFFAGKNKGRIKQLQNIINIFLKYNITYKFIVSNAEKFNSENVYTKAISYDEVLTENINSRAILDVNYNEVYGMTMRELEALFLKKKLITNNTKIKNRDFYHPNNVYIIENTNNNEYNDINDFLKLPFTAIDEDILNSYSVESWFQRFA